MEIIKKLARIWHGSDEPFLIHPDGALKFSDLINDENAEIDLSAIAPGDTVALIGDFDPPSISTLLKLIDQKAVIVPLTDDTKAQHDYFFESAGVKWVIRQGTLRRQKLSSNHALLSKLERIGHAGLILFSTGTTGRPKAILHDLTLFLERFETPRPTFRTMSFLLFDHIGGINTLLHTLFNKGTVIAPGSRNVEDVLQTCEKYNVEVLPTTPTFMRLMLISGYIPDRIPKCLKVITYGTERMDQNTLNAYCELLPDLDFRQTFGMSELGIVRVKSKARNSLYMRVGGEGIETRVRNKILNIKSESRMLGYLNAPDPFDEEGWYDTKDVVEEEDGYYKVVGRISDIINVGGLKFMASEVERIVLQFDGVGLASVKPKDNPITGQHVELVVEPAKNANVDKGELKLFLSKTLPDHMMPKRIKIEKVEIGHRHKRL